MRAANLVIGITPHPLVDADAYQTLVVIPVFRSEDDLFADCRAQFLL